MKFALGRVENTVGKEENPFICRFYQLSHILLVVCLSFEFCFVSDWRGHQTSLTVVSLTHYQTTNLRQVQIETVFRRQFQI